MDSIKKLFTKSTNQDSANSIKNIIESKYYYDSANYYNNFYNSSFCNNSNDSDNDFLVDIEYKKNGIFKRIIDEPVDNALRNWIEISDSNLENKKNFESILKQLSLKTYISKGFKMARLFGSALFILNFNDGKELSEPVDFTEVTEFDILYVAKYGNFMPYFSNNLLEPDFYYLTKTTSLQQDNLNIHPDRTILMVNDPLYDDVFRKYNQSTTNFVKKYLKKLDYLYDSVSKIIDMSLVDILKFNSDNFMNMNSTGLINEIQERITLISRGRSINKMIGITDKDEIKRIEANLSNFSDLIQKFQEELCSAADIPSQILFGGQLKGSLNNSNGDNIMDVYYNKIQSKQEVILRPVLEEFFSIISKVYDLNKVEAFSFKALHQLSEMEKIEIESAKIKLEIEKLNLEKTRNEILRS